MIQIWAFRYPIHDDLYLGLIGFSSQQKSEAFWVLEDKNAVDKSENLMQWFASDLASPISGTIPAVDIEYEKATNNELTNMESWLINCIFRNIYEVAALLQRNKMHRISIYTCRLQHSSKKQKGKRKTKSFAIQKWIALDIPLGSPKRSEITSFADDTSFDVKFCSSQTSACMLSSGVKLYSSLTKENFLSERRAKTGERMRKMQDLEAVKSCLMWL